MDDLLYLAFEEKFRGPRDLIKSRLNVYLPFIEPLLKFINPASVLDLGCGRCEWLELVREHGFDALGVDINAAMLSDCRKLGLNVHAGDAIEFLRKLPDVSQAVVSGFHIAEHITFAALKDLVSESLRVLKPGGLLILETPNPENLVVGACSFYLDPTHQRPIPPQMLEFVSEFGGFKRSKILRLQEETNLIYSNAVSLMDVLNGVSPDYAVVAQKDGPQALFDSLNSAFGAKYGVTLESLANKYQQLVDFRQKRGRREMDRMLEVMLQTQALHKEAEARATDAEARIAQAESREADAHDQVKHALNLVQQALASAEQAEARTMQAEARATQAEAREAEAQDQLQHALTEVQQFRSSAEQAEARAAQAEARASQAEAREAEAQDQVQHALNLVQHAQLMVEQAEDRASQAENRGTQAEAREAEARDQVQHTLALMQQAQAQTEQAEARADRLEERLVDITAQLAHTQEELHQVHQANHHHWQQLEATRQELHQIHQANHHHWQQLEATRQELHNVHQANHHHWLLANDRQDQISALRDSLSWRITAPLRWLGGYALSLTPSALSTRYKRVLLHAGRYVERHPRLKLIALKVFHRFPSLERRVMSIVSAPEAEIKQPTAQMKNPQANRPMAEADLAHLTPRALQILIDLKATIAQQNQEQA